MIEDCPEGWDLVRLGQITSKVGSGSTPRGGSESYQQTGIPLIRSMNVRFEGFTKQGLAFLNQKQADTLREVTVRPKDVLLNITGASIGRVTQAPAFMDGARVNQHVCIIRPFREIDAGYLSRYLASPSAQEMIWGEQYGVTRQALTKSQILDFQIPLAPPKEQRRIVERIDALFERVSSARDHLSRVRALLKRFREAVLTAACSGRLTEGWRATRPADATRTQSHDLANSGDLPEGWTSVTGDKLFKWSSGKFLPKRQQRDGPFLIYGGNGIAGHHAEWLVDMPTLVIGRVGALCGNVYATEGSVWVTDNAIYAKEIAPQANLRFVSLVYAQSDLNANAGGSGQPFVNQKALDSVVISLPPLIEQAEIMRRFDALSAMANIIEARVASGVARANKLTQSVLAKAFRGELVPTEAELARREGREYESASASLERMRSERASPLKNTSGRKRSVKEPSAHV